MRGWLDRLVGGVGLRRGRREARRLRVGDALDVWRVEEIERGRLLRLRAAMRLPGPARLEMRVDGDGGGPVRYRQRALFHSRGLLGHLHWWSVSPFRAVVFGGMARNIVRAAARAQHDHASTTEPLTTGRTATGSAAPPEHSGEKLKPMRVSVVLFTSDLRLHDHPPLHAALKSADAVVPFFVRDLAVEAAGFATPNRSAFLADCLADLDASLRERGGHLVVRSGDPVEEVCRAVREADADEVHMAAAHSAFAIRREDRLRRALESGGRRLVVHDAVTVAVPPGEVTPSSSDHFAVFTPYYRQWAQARLRTAVAAPRRVPVPGQVNGEPVPARSEVTGVSPALPRGGETEGRKRMTAYWRHGLDAYDDTRDDLAADATSRLSAHLHFGTLSPVELVHRARHRGGPGAEALVRQLAWRDFHRQVLAARPVAARADYRTKGDRWRTERTAKADIEAWREGRTGYPVIDAAMRQLRHEGWMHNRARLLTASFLTKTLYVDWRIGAAHFLHWLVDGDIANNQLNWQWVAGTGTDTRPGRVLNPVIQAKRYDPHGTYVHRWVPELRNIDAPAVHEPWKLHRADRAALDYPDPIVDLSEGLDRFRRARRRQE